jgi:hypothetical protein
MKDLIIGCSTNYDWSKLKYWVNSINQSGFEGDKVLILMNCDAETVQKVVDSGFAVIAFNQDEKGNLTHQSQMPVHVERFLHIYNFLKDRDYRYVITTDVKDVVFQKNPIQFLENRCVDSYKSMVFASESLLYQDEPWGNQNLMETFGNYVYQQYKDKEIYNVGVLAGRGNAIRDLAINIFVSCTNRPIPICDQSTFNFLISSNPYKLTSIYADSEEGWAAQLGTTMDPTKIDAFGPLLLEPTPKFENGKVTTSTGKEFYIVHQYDRVPELKEHFEKLYA